MVLIYSTLLLLKHYVSDIVAIHNQVIGRERNVMQDTDVFIVVLCIKGDSIVFIEALP